MKITHLKRNLPGAGLLFMMLLSLSSCTKTPPPEPSENPIYLTSDAQTKDTWVKNLSSIKAENPDKDIYEFSIYGTYWEKISNDWITLYTGEGVSPGVIRITVTENTSPDTRCYVLTITSKVWEAKIPIIQAGKS